MRLLLVIVFVGCAIVAVIGRDLLHFVACIVGGACVLSWPQKR